MTNILLNQPFDTPYQTPPFSKIDLKDYKPSIEKAIEEAKEEINQITNSTEIPSFKNTIETLETSGTKLSRISSIFFNLNSAETSNEMQNIAQEISPLLSEFSSDVKLNKDLFEKIKTVYDNQAKEKLNQEQIQLLDKTYKSFTRNGALLDNENQKELRQIDNQLALLSLKFGQNVLAETNAYFLHLTNKEEVEGLPEDELNSARETAKSKNLEGWVITLHMPSYLGFMKYAKRRDLREKLYKANGAKAFNNNEYNNCEVIREIINLRYKRAQILGYATHADFVLEERMAKTPETVKTFLADLLQKSKSFGDKDVQMLADYAKQKDNITNFMPWDHAYYAEQYKQETFNLSEQETKPYFELKNVVEGAFLVAKKLYTIDFRPIETIDKYHPEVTTYEVVKDNKVIGIFYTDFFPREGKRAGAWMTSYRNGSYENNTHIIPQISIVCNFTKPTANKPSLLTFNEVTTLFHEFGHALHGLLANTQYESLSGTNVSWDFVELPSQFMENFCYEPEVLSLFAKHYKTGEIIPQDLINKIVASSQFLEGYQTVRQLSFGILDMAWHTTNPSEITDIDSFEKKAFEGTQTYPFVEGTNMSTAFSHIFQGGYSSGYYSYKWAEVLDADAFAYFKENGIFNPDIAKKFYTILSSGGTVDPMELYVNFRGKKPNNEALLKRAGLI